MTKIFFFSEESLCRFLKGNQKEKRKMPELEEMAAVWWRQIESSGRDREEKRGHMQSKQSLEPSSFSAFSSPQIHGSGWRRGEDGKMTRPNICSHHNHATAPSGGSRMNGPLFFNQLTSQSSWHGNQSMLKSSAIKLADKDARPTWTRNLFISFPFVIYRPVIVVWLMLEINMFAADNK